MSRKKSNKITLESKPAHSKKKKKPGRKKSSKLSFESKTVQNKIKKIFDSSQPDLSYITKDKKLLKKHINFINSLPYCPMSTFVGPISHQKLTIKKPQLFVAFHRCYEPIFRRWLRLLAHCYNERSECYQFFGKRGIKMSDDFLDCKKFCIWCLTNGLVYAPDSYINYLVRKDKSDDYTLDNVRIISEKQLHNEPDITDALDTIILAKCYEACHHESVSYMSAYTRYYVYDFTIEDAISVPYMPSNKLKSSGEISIGFQPLSFYKSVADENSCTWSEFWSRMHMTYMSKIPPRPYDLLSKEFSTVEHVAKLGVKSYKQLWEESLAEKKNSDPNEIKSRYSKLEQNLLKNKDLQNMKMGKPDSMLEDIIREL